MTDPLEPGPEDVQDCPPAHEDDALDEEKLPPDVRRARVANLRLCGWDDAMIAEALKVSTRTVRRDRESDEAVAFMRESIRGAAGRAGTYFALAGETAGLWALRVLRGAVLDGGAEDSPAVRFAARIAAQVIAAAVTFPSPAAEARPGLRPEDIELRDWMKREKVGCYSDDPAKVEAFVRDTISPSSAFFGARRAWREEQVAEAKSQNSGAANAPEGARAPESENQ